MNATPKQHHFAALDGMRALLMLFGIFLHSALNYTVKTPHFSWISFSQQHNVTFDMIVMAIHVFRMPAFYLLAGFFACFSLQHRGVNSFVKRRLWRIGLPFAVIMFVPAVIAMFVGEISKQGHLLTFFWQSLREVDAYWFLYYLLWFYVLMLLFQGFGKILPKQIRLAWHELMRKAFTTVPGMLIVMVLTGCILFSTGNWSEPVTASIVPNWLELLGYGLFFMGCWTLCQHAHVLKRLSIWTFIFLAASSIALCCYLQLVFHVADNEKYRFVAAMLYGVISWLMTLGLLGLFMLLIRKQNKVWRYFSDASYWCYLVQLPIILYLQLLLVPATFSVWIQYGCVNIIAMGI